MRLQKHLKKLLRPVTVMVVVFTMLISFYLYSTLQQYCGSKVHLFRCLLVSVDTDWKPTKPAVSNACYRSNLLTHLAAMTDQDEVQRQLPIRPGFYATLKTPIELANLTSEACANALTPPVSSPLTDKKINDSNCFKRLVSHADTTEAYKQLSYLLNNFTSRGLEVFLLDGSLIGSVRHLGLVPWDDDLDFAIRVDQKSDVRHLFEELATGASPYLFLDTEALNLHWKLGIMCSSVKSANGTKSCRLAIDFFLVQISGRWFVRPEQPNVFLIEDIYPLSWRPFGPGLLLPSPRRPLHFLQRQYQSDVMQRCYYQPHTSTGCLQPSVSCLTMRNLGRYPFVEFVRLPAPSGWSGEKNVTVELLLWQRKLISVFLPLGNEI